MDGETTHEINWVGPETTHELALPVFEEDDPLWVRFLCAMVGTTIGAVLAVVFLYFLFQWWVGTA